MTDTTRPALGNVHVAQLQRLREEYTDRRTVPYGMLTLAIEISEGAALEERRVAAAAAAAAETERARLEASIEHWRGLWTDSHAMVQRYQSSAPTTLRVTDRDDTVNVVVKAPAGGWTLGKFEDAAYQLRTAGGDDDLPIEWTCGCSQVEHSRTALPDECPYHHAPTSRASEFVEQW